MYIFICGAFQWICQGTLLPNIVVNEIDQQLPFEWSAQETRTLILSRKNILVLHHAWKFSGRWIHGYITLLLLFPKLIFCFIWLELTFYINRKSKWQNTMPFDFLFYDFRTMRCKIFASSAKESELQILDLTFEKVLFIDFLPLASTCSPWSVYYPLIFH